jgi:hypothetical protein
MLLQYERLCGVNLTNILKVVKMTLPVYIFVYLNIK